MTAKTLTHWSGVTHICVSKLSTIGSDNGLSPGRRQAIIWNNARILLMGHLGTKIQWNVNRNSNIFKKMRLKMPSGKRRPFCLGLNVLKGNHYHKFCAMRFSYFLSRMSEFYHIIKRFTSDYINSKHRLLNQIGTSMNICTVCTWYIDTYVPHSGLYAKCYSRDIISQYKILHGIAYHR